MYLFLADIHLGVAISEDVFMKSLDFAFDIIDKSDEECHQIFVCGDLFDRKLNTQELGLAARFMLKLLCNGKRKDNGNIGVTFIHGTYSHDQEQYMIFIPIIERITGVRVRYIDKACTFKLENGKTVLALPQEYGDIDYIPFFRNKYDIIIGHGPMSSINDEPCPSGSSEICMPADVFGDISNICVFGHYHEFINFGKNVFYAGSMLRWKFGEPSQKVILTCDDKWNVTKHINPYAVDFVKVDIFSPDQLRNKISDDITTPHRFIIHCKENELNEYHSIMNIYKKNKMITCKFISEKNDKYNENDRLPTDFVPVANIEPVPALISYIKEKYNTDATEIVKGYESKINNEEEKKNV